MSCNDLKKDAFMNQENKSIYLITSGSLENF